MQEDRRRIISYSTVKTTRVSEYIDFIIIFVILNKKMNIICHFIFNYDDNLIFVMFYIKISGIIIFFTNFESVISWYYLPQVFEAVKKLHKLQFTIWINRTNLRFLFVGQKVRKTHVNVYQQSKLNYNHQLYFQKKHLIFHDIVNKSAQG